MNAEPQKEHQWLQKLVGDWSFENECIVGPDQPPLKHTGTESVRSIGGLWTIGEGTGPGPDGSEMKSIMTLGYDPQAKRFVGTFIASMMTYLWIYSGSLDAAGKVLTLNAEGPDFSGGPNMVKYQDIIEFVSDDHRTLKSQLLGLDGKWNHFMTAHYRRKK
jgi:hypothetical protein